MTFSYALRLLHVVSPYKVEYFEQIIYGERALVSVRIAAGTGRTKSRLETLKAVTLSGDIRLIVGNLTGPRLQQTSEITAERGPRTY
jgi:hypothetical protein